MMGLLDMRGVLKNKNVLKNILVETLCVYTVYIGSLVVL